ncbi:MAG: metallophosphoesterase [Nanoarchaeota archaeon]|nr:metallophosphoesterase [Nanoarchaeota archaeon]
MKLLIAADPHVDFETNLSPLKEFYSFAEEKKPDLIILLGDISAAGFESVRYATKYQELADRIDPIVEKSICLKYAIEFSDLSPAEIREEMSDIAGYIATYSPYDDHVHWREISEVYMEFIKHITTRLKRSYTPIKRVIKTQRDKTIAIPGDHDYYLDKAGLKGINLHKKTRRIHGLKLSGYGGAAGRDGVPRFKGIPPELTTPFNEYPTRQWVREGSDDIGHLEAKLVSEPRDFLEQAQPDIALLHTPLYGLMDLPGRLLEEDIPEEAKHIGSIPLRQYAETGKTKVFLFGHVHDCQGVEKIPRNDNEFVVAINPGALGDTEFVPGGYFAEVEIDDSTKEFVSAKFYEILKGGGITPNSLYVRRGTLIDRIDIKGTTTAYAAIQQNPGSLIIQPSSDELRSEDNPAFQKFLEDMRRLKD